MSPHIISLRFFKETLPFLLYGMTTVVEVWDLHICHLEVSSLIGGLLRPPRMTHPLRVLLSPLTTEECLDC